jgi:hypothetical protein
MPTVTIYGHPGNNPGEAWDGNARRQDVSETWTTIRNTPDGTHAQATTNGTTFVQLACSTTTNQFRFLCRGIIGMNTTILDPNWTLDNATLYIKGLSKTNTYTNSVSTAWRLAIVKMINPGDTISLASYNHTRYSTNALATTTYNDYSLEVHNAFPIPVGEVNKGANTYFGGRSNYDINDSPPAWQSFADIRVNAWYADQTGTADDPYMIVTYNSGTAAASNQVIII